MGLALDKLPSITLSSSPFEGGDILKGYTYYTHVHVVLGLCRSLAFWPCSVKPNTSVVLERGVSLTRENIEGQTEIGVGAVDVNPVRDDCLLSTAQLVSITTYWRTDNACECRGYITSAGYRPRKDQTCREKHDSRSPHHQI